MKARSVAIFFLLRLPGGLRQKALRRLFGFDVHPSARIGICYIDVEMLQMGPNSLIRHLTVIKGLDKLIMGENARIGTLNWISGFPRADKSRYEQVKDRDPSLYLGFNSSIMQRHLIDCTDAVRIGDFSGISGYRTQLLTHSIDLKTSRQSCRPIEIGSYSLVATGSIMLGGSRLPDYSALGPGSLLRTAETSIGVLYSGVPAVPVTEITGAWFSRPPGPVR